MSDASFVPTPDFAVGEDGLTDKQRRLVVFILQTQEKHGRPPSVREMAAFLGANSTTPATHLLDLLWKKGYVAESTGGAHGVKLRGLRTVLAFDDTPEGKRLERIYRASKQG